MAVPNKHSVLDGFEIYREQVLSQPWADGLRADEVSEYLKGLADYRFASLSYRSEHPYPYLQPRGGYPTFEKQKALSEALDEAGADFIPLTIDSHTRHNDYSKADQLLRDSLEEGKDLLNGYPLVCHGYESTRRLYENVQKPICLRHGTPDARLLVETAIASGLTEIEGGGLVYSLPYSENFPIDRSIIYWQYVDRLCAEYSTPERPIHRESFGPLSATMVPPMIVIAVELIELLLAAEQGVKSFSVSFGQTGSFSQDIALAKVLMSMARDYLDRFGFSDVDVYLVYHQWMGDFPMERDKAGDLIAMSAVIARLARADKIIVKTRDEALGLPTAQSNCDAVRDVRYIFEKFPVTGAVTSEAIEEEAELIGGEVRHLMDAIFNMEGDAFWESVYKAVRDGMIDIPFAPHRMNANKMLTTRDRYQAIRISEPGNVPMCSQDRAKETSLLKLNSDEDAGFFNKMIKDIHVMN
ncbi:MAG: methylaspartate mutase subunit E [Chloroflexi bacterium]|nr:methylaspartate mutase subunit E [Chloroflexota bacterium]MCH7652063.1 methylaspartate mutase subunit E [Chloroflexota bacterium]